MRSKEFEQVNTRTLWHTSSKTNRSSILSTGLDPRIQLYTELKRTYYPDAIGIKVTRTDILSPNYLRYVFQHLHSTDMFANMSIGVTNLVHIRARDIAALKVGPR